MTEAIAPVPLLRETMEHMRELADYWEEEIPVRVHSRDTAENGNPEWHPDFARWIGGWENLPDRKWQDKPESRVRATRAFRKLRKAAVREFEVLYRTAILDIPPSETLEWLNDRAIRNQIPLPEGRSVHYTMEDLAWLLIVGTDKVWHWWASYWGASEVV